MANSLYKSPSYSPQVKHNGFNMSMRRLFTAPVGMMLPVYCDIVQANDKYKLNVDAFIRTEAVQTAAFQNFRAHFDWFFVPFRQLYQFFNEFYNGTFDANTDYVSKISGYSLPTLTFDFSSSFASANQDIFDYYFDEYETKYYAKIDEFGSPYIGNAVRLADLLGYGDIHRFVNGSGSGQFKFDFFPYKYLAYHKIFFHPKYNRSDWFERQNYLFNVDSYHGAKIDSRYSGSILSKIHYRPYSQDYFSGVFPSPLFSRQFANIVSDAWLLQGYNIGEIAPEYGASAVDDFDPSSMNSLNLVASKPLGGSVSNSAQVELTQNGHLDVNSLRALFDFEKLCRITALAGSHYTEQLYAHFGVTVDNDIHNEAYYIGSQGLDISISEVVATASTGSSDSGSSLGDIAGKGFGVSQNDGDLNFHAKEQGVLMCIFSIEPLQMYSSDIVERNGLYLKPLDFYRRELDNLGMQPMMASELNSGQNLGNQNAVLGFNYRYAELKTKVDIVNLGFTSVKTDWQCNYQGGINFNTANRNYRFFVNPSYTDSIFEQFYIKPTDEHGYLLTSMSSQKLGDWSSFSNIDIFKGDNFLINAQFNVLKDSIMSVHSLPSLN